jgi:hypothetical protein
MKRKAKASEIELFKEIYDRTLSLRKNRVILEEAGLKMSLSKLQDWVDKYIEPAAEPVFATAPTASNPSVLYTVPSLGDWTFSPSPYGVTVSDWDLPEAREETNKFQWFTNDDFPFRNWQPDFSKFHPAGVEGRSSL